MEFSLEGWMEFSKRIDFLSAELPSLIATEINPKLFRKGVPQEKEGSRIVHWRIEGTKLYLIIEGTTYLRPHDAFLRLRNFLAEKWGKEYKVGVRSVGIKFYTITLEIKKVPREPIELKVPWVEDIQIKQKKVVIKLRDLDSTAIEDRYIERIIKRVEEKINLSLYGGKAEHWELMWESRKRKPVWDKDPTKEMEKRGWIKKFDVGVWLHTPITAKMIRTFYNIALRYIIRPLGFEEIILPKTVPLEVWLRTGHMPGSINSFYYVCRPGSWDPKYWEDVADYIKITHKIPYEKLKEKLDKPSAGICFSQCPPLYWFFKGKKIPERSLPLKFWDASGPSYRWEGGGLHGLERDSEFHRIEIVWLGKRDQVLEIKEQLLKKFKMIFDKIMQIEWRMAWVTPWYMQQAGQVGIEEEKVKGTIDFEAWLPWRGSREKSEWLEFQNLTVAGTKFSDAWKYVTDKGNEVWSGCSGIGLERWMVVFLSQKGLDPKKWPSPFRKIFGKMPKEIKLLD